MSVLIRRRAAAWGAVPHGIYPGADDIKYFVSTGRKDVRGGMAEYLKASPDLVDRCTAAAGPIHPPGKYLVVQACEALPDPMPAVMSLCIFGNGEQIRNMAALIHFDRDDPFSPVIVPWGSSCSTFITFPAGLAENTPKTPRSWALRTRPRTIRSLLIRWRLASPRRWLHGW